MWLYEWTGLIASGGVPFPTPPTVETVYPCGFFFKCESGGGPPFFRLLLSPLRCGQLFLGLYILPGTLSPPSWLFLSPLGGLSSPVLFAFGFSRVAVRAALFVLQLNSILTTPPTAQ